jgi:hypothetical protein
VTISIRSRSYELPIILMNCPKCRSGVLEWDGHGAWRCDGTKCRNGVALSAIFDDIDLEIKLSTGLVDLSRLPLAEYGCTLVLLGVLVLPWMTVARLRRETARLRLAEAESAKFNAMMRRSKEADE